MRNLRRLRIALAAFSLLALTAVFLDFTGTAAAWFDWTAKLQFWPSVLALSLASIVAILACTLLFGRVYCSVVCPLGIFQDLLIFLRRLFGFRFAAEAEAPKARVLRECLRGGLAAIFLGGGFLGLHFQWLEPYAIYGRAASVLLAPLARLVNNELAAWAERRASYAFHAVEIVMPATSVIVVSAGVLALIVVLAVWKGRLWCNAVCPVGTLLGYASKVSLTKPTIDLSKCVKCGLCARACKAQCIDVANGTVDRSKCVACFDCGAVCGKGALKWSK